LRPGSKIARIFDAWVEHLDQHAQHELTSVKAWTVSSLFVLVFFPVVAKTPALKPFFELRLGPVLITYVPLAVMGFGLGAWHRQTKIFGRTAWFVVLVGTSYVQFFCASLVAWSGPRAASVVASLFLFTAGYHGHAYRVTLREPLLAIGTLLAVCAAALLNPTADRIAVLSLIGGAAISLELVAGTVALRGDQVQRRTKQLQAAVHAQLLGEQERELNRVSDRLVEALGGNHDLNNAVMAVNLHAELLLAKCATVADAEVSASTAPLRQSLTQLNQLFSELRAKATPTEPNKVEEVDLLPTLEAVRASVRARFPGVSHRLERSRAEGLRASVRGGALTLHRLVENLLINACEGDGQRGARTVELKVARDESGARAQIVIIDDGPGFRPEQLGPRVEPFGTSKPHGSGLGLFTAERLVQASGGSLHRANRPEGGAAVTVYLPLWGAG
jgi:signal transduction histidine kinase